MFSMVGVKLRIRNVPLSICITCTQLQPLFTMTLRQNEPGTVRDEKQCATASRPAGIINSLFLPHSFPQDEAISYCYPLAAIIFAGHHSMHTCLILQCLKWTKVAELYCVPSFRQREGATRCLLSSLLEYTKHIAQDSRRMSSRSFVCSKVKVKSEYAHL